ncbi:MAG: DUF3014 domain-containing protein [Rhodocyclaceae bacterium]|nr:MAG: DUF3014 domain-containing protein [Rhodocyclaceae bacterium]
MQPKFWITVVVIVVGTVLAGYFLMQSDSPAPPAPAQPSTRPPPASGQSITPEPAPAAPVIRYPLNSAVASPLPELDKSDAGIMKALGELLGRKRLGLSFTDGVIRRVVATVDNLPRQKLPVSVMPLKRVPKTFVTTGEGDSLAIGPSNSLRYTPYVRFFTAIDTANLVALYVRFYPLFQKVYEDLGYPKGYFNDRLVEAIDDLLASPELPGSIKLVQPGVLYEFALPDLEARSAGQKILMRMGRNNSAAVKTKLREIQQEVTNRPW